MCNRSKEITAVDLSVNLLVTFLSAVTNSLTRGNLKEEGVLWTHSPGDTVYRDGEVWWQCGDRAGWYLASSVRKAESEQEVGVWLEPPIHPCMIQEAPFLPISCSLSRSLPPSLPPNPALSETLQQRKEANKPSHTFLVTTAASSPVAANSPSP